MIWLWYVGGGVAALFVIVLIWGCLHLWLSRRQAQQALQSLEIAEIEQLAEECVAVFREKLGLELNLTRAEASAAVLDRAFEEPEKLKAAFARDDFYWYFSKPVGAFLGELVRRNSDFQWQKEPDAVPWLSATRGDHSVDMRPFKKVLKQILQSDPGDFVAYVGAALTLSKTA